MKSLKRNYLFQLSSSVFQIAAPIITFPYISRILGPEHIGKINFLDYSAQIILLIASFGIPLYGVREISKVRNNKKEVQIIFSELVVIHVSISLIAVFFFILLINLSPEIFIQRNLILLSAINIIINGFSLQWFIQGLEDFKFIAKCSIGIKLLNVIAIFAFVNQSDDYHIYYLILIVSSCLLVFLDIIYAFKNGYFFVRNINPLKHIPSLFVLFITTTTISLYTYLDTYILGIMAGSLAVGYFTTALKIVRLTLNFINEFSGLLLPRVAFLIANKDNNEIERLLNKSLNYVFTLSIPITFYIFISAPEIISIIAGNQFLPSVQSLQIISFLPIINGISNIYIFQLLMPYGKEKKVLLSVVLGGITSILLNLLLIPLYKQNGAAFACILAEFIVMLFVIVHSKNLLKLNFSGLFIGKIIFSCLPFYPIIMLARLVFSNEIVYLLITTGITCFLIYLILQLLVFQNNLMKEIVDFLHKIYIKPSK